jgi:hypothetical protein
LLAAFHEAVSLLPIRLEVRGKVCWREKLRVEAAQALAS